MQVMGARDSLALRTYEKHCELSLTLVNALIIYVY